MPKKEQPPAELLTAGLIHELRHPLMGIKLGLQLIQRGAGEAVSKQAEWPMVMSQLARLEELLRSYQRFLSPEAAGPGLFELAPVVQQAIDLCQLRLKRLGAKFSYEPPPSGVFAHGGPDALTHALTNVLFNALDAVGDAGRICVRVCSSAKHDGRIEVRVSDEGTGIAPAILERIFEPRFTTKPVEKGSGLGLAIARRMMEAAGGEVGVVERADPLRLPWATTEFRILLWAKVDAPAAVAPSPQNDALPTVLLVEDDVAIGPMLQRGLELGGYAVTTVRTAEEAMPLLKSQRFDAVLTDKNLPGASGEDVARAVRAASEDTALVMMTGYASRESVRELQAQRADAYLLKPFELPDLQRLVGQVIARRRNQPKVKRAAVKVVVVEPDANDCARLEKLLLGMKVQPMVRGDVLAALDEAPDALIISSGRLTEAIKQRILALEVERPGLRVVLLSPFESMTESINAILLNAAGQLVAGWSDEAAAAVLQRALGGG